MVSVSKILMFAFRHLVISGVSCYSCLWLELVPQVILLASISRPGRLVLSSEFQWSEHSLQASSPLAGKVHRGLELSSASWLKMKAQKGPCSRICVASAHTLLQRLDSEEPEIQDGPFTCSTCQSPPWRPSLLWRGKCVDVWSSDLIPG